MAVAENNKETLAAGATQQTRSPDCYFHKRLWTYLTASSRLQPGTASIFEIELNGDGTYHLRLHIPTTLLFLRWLDKVRDGKRRVWGTRWFLDSLFRPYLGLQRKWFRLQRIVALYIRRCNLGHVCVYVCRGSCVCVPVCANCIQIVQSDPNFRFTWPFTIDHCQLWSLKSTFQSISIFFYKFWHEGIYERVASAREWHQSNIISLAAISMK